MTALSEGAVTSPGHARTQPVTSGRMGPPREGRGRDGVRVPPGVDRGGGVAAPARVGVGGHVGGRAVVADAVSAGALKRGTRRVSHFRHEKRNGETQKERRRRRKNVTRKY